jgi:hypothetical protein
MMMGVKSDGVRRKNWGRKGGGVLRVVMMINSSNGTCMYSTNQSLFGDGVWV